MQVFGVLCGFVLVAFHFSGNKCGKISKMKTEFSSDFLSAIGTS